MEEKKDIASDGGHWYAQDGSPAYTYTDSKGSEKPTTLRQARKLGLLPSVTTILQVYPKPMLNKWIQKQTLLSALTLNRLDNEPDEAFIQRIIADADEQARMAREKGTEIHGMLERYLTGQELDTEGVKLGTRVINAVIQHINPGLTIDDFFMACESERSFASAFGYGGKVDLHSKKLNFVLDFKSKEGDLEGVALYDEHKMQLQAYANGLNMPDDCLKIICFVSTTCDAVKCITAPNDINDFDVFMACLNLWQKMKKYVPKIGESNG